MRTLKTLIIMAVMVISGNQISTGTTISGNVFLSGQSDHSGIKVKFIMVAPVTLYDSVFTTGTGHFQKSLDNGIYTIEFSKEGYVSAVINDIQLYSDKQIDDLTLSQSNFCGSIKGVINPGNYIIGCDISVLHGDTLLIKPGVVLNFASGTRFEVYGLLLAEGSKADSIIFTAANKDLPWKGLKFLQNASPFSKLEYCSISNSNNGGIYAENDSLSLLNSTIQNNTYFVPVGNSEIVGGAGIWLKNTTLLLSSCFIVNNRVNVSQNTDGCGGGILNYYGRLYIYNSSICNNTATGISDNPGNGDGGGIANYGSKIVIKNSQLNENYSNRFGGAIFDDSGDSEITIDNSMIYGNSANTGSVFVCYVIKSLKIYSSTIIYNYGSGDNLFHINSFDAFLLVNSVLSNNGSYAEAIKFYYYTDQSVVILSNDFYDNTTSYNNTNPVIGGWENKYFGKIVDTLPNGAEVDAYLNIFENPEFVSISTRDFRLKKESLCIDAGINDSVMSVTDLSGINRITDGNDDDIATVDLGAYEFNPDANPLSSPELPAEDAYKIYPNPAKELFYIENNSSCLCPTTMKIIGLDGKLFKSELLNKGMNSIQAPPLSKGLYLINLINENTVVTKILLFQ